MFLSEHQIPGSAGPEMFSPTATSFSRSRSVSQSSRSGWGGESVGSDAANFAATARMDQLAATTDFSASSSRNSTLEPSAAATPFRGISRRDLDVDDTKPHFSVSISSKLANPDRTAANRRAWMPTAAYPRPGICPHCGTTFTAGARLNHNERALVYVCSRCRLTVRVGPAVPLEANFQGCGDVVSTYSLHNDLQRSRQLDLKNGAKTVLRVLRQSSTTAALRFWFAAWTGIVQRPKGGSVQRPKGGSDSDANYEIRKMRQFRKMLAGAPVAEKDRFVLKKQLLEPFISGVTIMNERRQVADYEAVQRSNSQRSFLRAWRVMMRNQGCDASGTAWFQLLADRGYESELHSRKQSFTPVPALTDYAELVCSSANEALERSKAACSRLDSSNGTPAKGCKSRERMSASQAKYFGSGLSMAGPLRVSPPEYTMPKIRLTIGAKQ